MCLYNVMLLGFHGFPMPWESTHNAYYIHIMHAYIYIYTAYNIINIYIYILIWYDTYYTYYICRFKSLLRDDLIKIPMATESTESSWGSAHWSGARWGWNLPKQTAVESMPNKYLVFPGCQITLENHDRWLHIDCVRCHNFISVRWLKRICFQFPGVQLVLSSFWGLHTKY